MHKVDSVYRRWLDVFKYLFNISFFRHGVYMRDDKYVA